MHCLIQNKTFRTRFLAFWVLTNATLAISIQNISGPDNSNPTADNVRSILPHNVLRLLTFPAAQEI